MSCAVFWRARRASENTNNETTKQTTKQRNLSNRFSGVQIPRHICTRFGRYLYSTRCSWIIKDISLGRPNYVTCALK